MSVRSRGKRFQPETILPGDKERKILQHSLGSGATPLSTTGIPEVARRQAKVQDKLRKRISYNLRDRSPLIRAFAEQNFLGRFARRLDRNRASYDTRLRRDIPNEIQDTHDRVLIGNGNPKEALVVMKALHMRSIELARLTHPDVDMNDCPELEEMHEDVYDAVRELGGDYCAEAAPSYEISNLDTIVPPEIIEGEPPAEHAGVREGIMATGKRHIATMQDGTKVMERTSYIIDLNKLPAVISRAIRSVNTLETKDALRAIAEVAQLNILLPHLLDGFEKGGAVIPISTTVYAFNEEIAHAIKLNANLKKDDASSPDKIKFFKMHEESKQELADKLGYTTPEQRERDPLTRSVGNYALGADVLYSDD